MAKNREIYYKAAKEIISKVLEIGATVIVMEDLEIYKEDKGSRELSGRLHRWSYRKFQRILEYQARLHGLNVKYVDLRNTSKMCPVCGGELSQSPNGRRLMRCWRCELEEDRDIVAVRKLARRYYKECMNAKISQSLSLMPNAR
jgi:putative transposase